MVWDFKGSEGNSQELSKYEKEQIFGKEMFAGPHRNNGTQRGLLTDCTRYLPIYHT